MLGLTNQWSSKVNPLNPKGSTRSAAEYGYKSGVILGSSGYLRVTVLAEKAMVEYVRMGGAGINQIKELIAHAYEIIPK